MTEKALIAQSKNAYNQWCVQWRDHAKAHSKYKMRSFLDFENIGIGKACLVVANGGSLETNIETIKKYKDNVDILCCDKTLGNLLDHGIVPTYCLVCDANVSYEKYLEPWKNKIKDVQLIMNVCGNPKWTELGAWKDMYFFVNMDVMKYEKEFQSLSGCNNVIAAATNVSNAQIVLLTQSNNDGRNNFFGYDKLLLIGFDYSWRSGGSYYAFDETGDGKHNYMRHIYLVNAAGQLCYTSTNLLFSAQWLTKYINTFKLPIVQCSKESILTLAKSGELEDQMQYKFKREDSSLVISTLKRRRKINSELLQIDSVIKKIGKDHYYNYIATVN